MWNVKFHAQRSVKVLKGLKSKTYQHMWWAGLFKGSKINSAASWGQNVSAGNDLSELIFFVLLSMELMLAHTFTIRHQVEQVEGLLMVFVLFCFCEWLDNKSKYNWHYKEMEKVSEARYHRGTRPWGYYWMEYLGPSIEASEFSLL